MSALTRARAIASGSNASLGSSPAISARRTRVGALIPIGSRRALSRARPGMSTPTDRPASRTRHRSKPPSTVGSCSAQSTAVPSRARSARRPATARVPAGSSWAVGSSRTSRLLPIVTMLAIATRCCSPPESAKGSRSARGSIRRWARTESIRASIRSRGSPRFSRPKASSSRTVSFEPESWFAGVEKTMPTRPRSAPPPAVSSASEPIVARPDSRARTTRGMNPAATSARVDLPAPVRPATPTRSPGATDRSSSVRAGSRRPTYRTETASRTRDESAGPSAPASGGVGSVADRLIGRGRR